MRKIIFLSILCIFCTIYFGCRKENKSEISAQEKYLDEARIFFNEYTLVHKTELLVNSDPSKLLVSLNKTPLWNKAEVRKISIGDVILVPIKYETELFASSNATGKHRISINDISKLLIYKDTSNRFKIEIVNSYPDKDFIDGKSKKFSGIISVSEWNGDFIRGFTYSDGKDIGSITISSKSNKQTDAIKQVNGVRNFYMQDPERKCYWEDLFRCNTATNECTLLTSIFLGCDDEPTPPPGGAPTGSNYQSFHTQRLLSQEEIDDQNVKDSTNDSCAAGVIRTLKLLNSRLPALVRDFFSSDANFDMTIKMTFNDTWNNANAPNGASTDVNITSNQFKVSLNSYYNKITDIGLAASLIHEAFHCQLLNWYRLAVLNNDQNTRESLATNYGYLFPPDFNSDSSLNVIVNGGNASQHQDMIFRYQRTIGMALYGFAQTKGIAVDSNYCKDLAWTGTLDSKAFKDLSYSTQTRIRDRVMAEKDPSGVLTDPSGNYTINANNISAKGTPCN